MQISVVIYSHNQTKNEQREIIALDRQGTQQQRPQLPTTTPPSVRFRSLFLCPLSVERYYLPSLILHKCSRPHSVSDYKWKMNEYCKQMECFNQTLDKAINLSVNQLIQW